MVAKVQQVESRIMAHFLFCVSMGGSQRYSVEFCFLYTLCIIVCATQAEFWKVCQVEFHTRFGGRERQQSECTSSLFTLFPPFTKEQRRLIYNKNFQWKKSLVYQEDEPDIKLFFWPCVPARSQSSDSQQESTRQRVHAFLPSTDRNSRTNFPAPGYHHAM